MSTSVISREIIRYVLKSNNPYKVQTESRVITFDLPVRVPLSRGDIIDITEDNKVKILDQLSTECHIEDLH